ncbi:hypothetical protein QZH41_005425 [Actinostola sp. cb2023]|nr:hypothetical protein QZH41_005425 [Actinostola sp. cb2023]
MLASCLKRRPNIGVYNDLYKEFTQAGKSSTGYSTGRSVTFADLVGERLEYVKTITPNSSFENLTSLCSQSPHHFAQSTDLNNNSSCCSKAQGLIGEHKKPTIKDASRSIKFLSCCLPQPIYRRDFDMRFEKNGVCLENVFELSCSTNGLVGIIRVKNVAYEKDVFVRYTLNRWRDKQEEKAEFIYQCSDGTADKFVFRLAIRPKSPGQEVTGHGLLEFAVGYQVNYAVYWDNNNGFNYKAGWKVPRVP